MLDLSPEDVAAHELRHILAASTALMQNGTAADYKSTIVHFDFTDEGATVHFAIEDPSTEDLPKKVTQLAALGPVVKFDGDLFDLIREGNKEALRKAGNLSPEDLDAAAQFDGPPMEPIKILLATKDLQEVLGDKGFDILAKQLRTAHNQHVEEFGLAELVPRKYAAAALKAAQDELSATSGIPQ
ncbi:hypothetical protein [Pseudoruegeria sp. HB172150]|uniref:hypothetical protein n=1 Tax=Pseudoruegeria sp. HB172150 TaxID=2721164 RepID=UPI0015538606|nr:hypothetical protein [Pseudoruegeria sp. HB172150]